MSSQHTTPRTAPHTYLGIQALRGVAACMVVLVHTTGIYRVNFGDLHRPHAFLNGSAGVDVFFVISGFIMTVTALGASQPSPANFLCRRLLRIVPLYWLFTFLTSAKALLVALHPSLGSNAVHFPLKLHYLLACLFFVPAYSPHGLIETIVISGWTLNYEMLFYLLFAVALFFKRRALAFLVPVLLLLGCIGLVHQPGTSLRPGWPAFTTVVDPQQFEFLAGILLGRLAQSTFTLNRSAAIVCGLLGFAGLLTLPMGSFPGSRELLWGLPAFLLVFAAVMLERSYGRRIPNGLLRLGDASYSLYLSHSLVLVAVMHLFLLCHVSSSIAVFTAVALITCIAAALLIYRFVERPITLALGRLTSVAVPISVLGTGPQANKR